ncbi:MAG: hypothetical protein BWK76_13300 [Desulfobulbaceae bacterium A2]|nr:MAG: hypothetical protein BWK76_13300 [Desulfobulbaceae bacterium A2]
MVVKQLGDINYVGRISPHLYGEPLLDNRLPGFIAETRLACPLANIVVMSNGDFLTRDILLSLVSAGMDEIYVTNYDLEDNSVVIALQKEFPDHVTMRNFKNVDKRNKAGILDNVVKVQDNNRPCLRPSSQMVINWEGQVILCCNDYYAKHVIGSVRDITLLNLWWSDELCYFKKILSQEHGRMKVDICRYCDG